MTAMNVLLDGPAAVHGAEPFAAHVARLGDLPPADARFIDTLQHAGLLGRGGAGFPTAAKWRAVLHASAGTTSPWPRSRASSGAGRSSGDCATASTWPAASRAPTVAPWAIDPPADGCAVGY